MGDVDQLRHTRERYSTSPMSMGKRKRDRQPTMWVTTTDLPTAASHPFYRRLNHLLREHGFDDFVEAQCAGFYAATMGRPASLLSRFGKTGTITVEICDKGTTRIPLHVWPGGREHSHGHLLGRSVLRLSGSTERDCCGD